MALATMFQLIPEADTTTKGGRTPEPSRNLNTLDRSTLIVSVIVTLIDPFKRNPILIIKAPIMNFLYAPKPPKPRPATLQPELYVLDCKLLDETPPNYQLYILNSNRNLPGIPLP